MLIGLSPSRAGSLLQVSLSYTKPETHHKSPVGAELARESGLSATVMPDLPPSSRASSAPTDFLSYTKSESEHKSPVGAGLLAKAVCQPRRCRMCRRLREQAQLLQIFCRTQNLSQNTKPLWERACSRKRSVSYIDVGCAVAFASKLSSYRFSVVHKI